MPARAPGLRAIASAAEPATRPCPRPQRPEAIAMPIPAPIGTQLGAELPPPVCANAGDAMQSTASVMKIYCSLRIVFLLASFKMCRQWVVEAHRAGPLTLTAAVPKWKQNSDRELLNLVPLLRRRFAEINHRQQHEHIRLNQRDAKV